MADQGLPMKFPCWVKAVYSWGGEVRNQLGRRLEGIVLML